MGPLALAVPFAAVNQSVKNSRKLEKVKSSTQRQSDLLNTLTPRTTQLRMYQPCLEAVEDVIKVRATVEKEGHISFFMREQIRVDIGPNQELLLHNPNQAVTVALSGCGLSMAMTHPMGNVLQYNSRIEIQATDFNGLTKNAKFFKKGISFTSNNMALVYLLDEAGIRTTREQFFKISPTGFVDQTFWSSAQHNINLEFAATLLEDTQYWHAGNVDYWLINGIQIAQTEDGLVTVQRTVGQDKFYIRASPNTGKTKVSSSFMYITASVGEEAHIFIKSNHRRIHSNGRSLSVRYGGHCAGFNEFGQLQIS